MKRKIYLVTLIAIIMLLSSCKDRKKEIEEEDNIQQEEEKIEENYEIDEIKGIVKNMNLDEKIGQLFIFGLNGTTVDDHIVEMIIKKHIGGFILFKYNIQDEEQTVQLLNSLKKTNISNDIPLFLSIDEEGGRVSRLPNSFLKLPPSKKIGDINDRRIAFEYGRILGKRIKSLGFNLDFAPVLDINSNPNNPVIGDRAFGSTIDIVVNNGLEVMEGINAENIISIVKHFPGHGDTKEDSHINLPIVEKDIKQLEELELVPFIDGIAKGVDGIMVGHILFPKLDNDNPATISKEIINNLLREKLYYNGVIISDDMTMGAIIKNYTIEEASVKFLQAGGDILLICHGYENQINVLNRIKEEIVQGNITEEEIDEKVYRIIKLKQKYAINDDLIDKLDIESINYRTQELLDLIR